MGRIVRVGFDYDEPIFPWYDYAHEASVEAGLTLPSSPPPTVWDPHSHYGVTLEAWIDVLDAEVRKGFHGMYARPCKPEAVSAIQKMHRMGYEVHLITARGSFGRYSEEIKRLTKSQVIRENIPHTGLHFAQDKSAVIRDLGIHYFIDDRPKHYAEAVEGGAEAYLLDERWNRDFEVPEGRRIQSTEEYADLIIERYGAVRSFHKPMAETV